jgi:hypothetical protein
MDSEPIKPTHYKELIIWQRAMVLAKSVYRLTAVFPVEEKYGLATQMRRTTVFDTFCDCGRPGALRIARIPAFSFANEWFSSGVGDTGIAQRGSEVFVRK